MPPTSYAAIRPIIDSIHEPLATKPYTLANELELQARWFAGEFGRDFLTDEGATIRIIQFGVWNHEAGPDFTAAAISINGAAPLFGAIEIDSHPRDWEAHGHAENPAFNAVILHVVAAATDKQTFSRTQDHRHVPQITLDVSSLDAPPPATLPAAKPGRCCAPLRQSSTATRQSILQAAAHFRLEYKARRLSRLADAHGADEALYQSLAAALGYKHNQLPFTLLAQRVPLRRLQKSSTTLESKLFGTAGFLCEPDLGKMPADTRDYLRKLWDDWWRSRSRNELLILADDMWTLGGSRPINHPQRRTAALAAIVNRWKEFRQAIESDDPKSVATFFQSLSHPYWQYHYTLTSRTAPRPMAMVGDSRVIEIQANVIFPWLHSQGHDIESRYTKLRAKLSNRTLETAVIRLFGDATAGKEFTRTVAGQQGLLQIYQDFCLQDASDCAHCPFPEKVVGWREENS